MEDAVGRLSFIRIEDSQTADQHGHFGNRERQHGISAPTTLSAVMTNLDNAEKHAD